MEQFFHYFPLFSIIYHLCGWVIYSICILQIQQYQHLICILGCLVLPWKFYLVTNMKLSKLASLLSMSKVRKELFSSPEVETLHICLKTTEILLEVYSLVCVSGSLQVSLSFKLLFRLVACIFFFWPTVVIKVKKEMRHIIHLHS